MPGCVALGCSNSDKKGFLMKCFPSDPIRRNDWVAAIGRGYWKPTKSSYLCETHFAPEMWEKPRVDGKRILKCNAVPTIFSFRGPKSQKEPPFYEKPFPPKQPHPTAHLLDDKMLTSSAFIVEPSRSSVNLPEDKPQNLSEESNPDKPSTSKVALFLVLPVSQQSSTSKFISSKDELIDCSHVSPEVSPNSQSPNKDLAESQKKVDIMYNEVSPNSQLPNKDLAESQKKVNMYKKLYEKEKRKAAHYKKLLRNTRYSLRKAERTSSDGHELLELLFNKDQISALNKKKLKKSTKLMKWSNNTLTKSLKLKVCCGKAGYEELINQGHPLPSIRTLQRKLQSLNFDSGIHTNITL